LDLAYLDVALKHVQAVNALVVELELDFVDDLAVSVSPIDH
jgi:hypothetical protein